MLRGLFMMLWISAFNLLGSTLLHAQPLIAHEVGFFESRVTTVEEIKEQYREKRIIRLANGTIWSNDNFLKAMAWRTAVYDDVLVTFMKAQLRPDRRLILGRAYFGGNESQVFWEGDASHWKVVGRLPAKV